MVETLSQFILDLTYHPQCHRGKSIFLRDIVISLVGIKIIILFDIRVDLGCEKK